MSERPTKIVVDLSKPKGERETVVELTDEEIAEREVRAAEAEAQRIAEEEAQAAKQAALESAETKLAALGLSAEEVSALLNK